jgi:phosphatidylethanolamine/phosphatidyl-N-methylethanolamine N-methyltransferase
MRMRMRMRVTNRWNRLVYSLWAPLYDGLFDRASVAVRRRAMEIASVRPGERVLLVGVGTGADLPLLPAGAETVGIDLTPKMLVKARAKLSRGDGNSMLVRGDAQRLPLRADSFDVAVLSLVLSVVPDGGACLRETVRALKTSGRIVVFDKFVPDGAEPTTRRKLFNLVTRPFGMDITRCLGDIMAGKGCAILHEEPGSLPTLLGGAYRVILIRPNYSENNPNKFGNPQFVEAH